MAFRQLSRAPLAAERTVIRTPTAKSRLNAMNKPVLLIIDVLNDFFRKEPLLSKRTPLVNAINELIRGFRERGQPIIWIRQEFESDLSDAFLEMRKDSILITITGTEGAQILPELDIDPVDQ